MNDKANFNENLRRYSVAVHLQCYDIWSEFNLRWLPQPTQHRKHKHVNDSINCRDIALILGVVVAENYSHS